jgi:hypothetical protein
MFVEAAVVILSGYALMIARREKRPGIHEAMAVS